MANRTPPSTFNKPTGLSGYGPGGQTRPAPPPKPKQPTQSGTNHWLDTLSDVKVGQPDQPSRPTFNTPPYRDNRSSQGPYRGPGNYRDERGPGNYRDERRPGGYRDERGPGNYRDERGPGGYRDERGPGNYRDERFHERNHGGYRDERGPSNYRDERSHGGYREGGNRGPGGYREYEQRGPGAYRVSGGAGLPGNYGLRPRPPIEGGFGRGPRPERISRPGGPRGVAPRAQKPRAKTFTPRPPAPPKPKREKTPPPPPFTPTPEQVVQVEARYLELAAPSEFDGIRTQISKELGIPKKAVKKIVKDLRSRQCIPSWWEVQTYKGSSEELERIRGAYEPLLPLPPVGVHKQIADQLNLKPGTVYQAIKAIRLELNLPQYNDPELHGPDFLQEAQSQEPTPVSTPSADGTAVAEDQANAGALSVSASQVADEATE
ncbi:hypothetical protein EPA93_24810 [Ktedonosporobacter rubrisoli]|uniref:Uncharacterized protein n=1 Tax=Ktedonosporobacter rubrisoli TaxID=2509675 RepID=A0A4P6JTV3_KTERU|nr:hypothetical protein [Ktedonosporobacter rubrisoli]QBD79029.1 hypothetical protein EPA93_24810 [Ktedonosporobacter rubrisoli]